MGQRGQGSEGIGSWKCLQTGSYFTIETVKIMNATTVIIVKPQTAPPDKAPFNKLPSNMYKR